MGPILLSDNQLEFGASKNTEDVKLLQKKNQLEDGEGQLDATQQWDANCSRAGKNLEDIHIWLHLQK